MRRLRSILLAVVLSAATLASAAFNLSVSASEYGLAEVTVPGQEDSGEGASGGTQSGAGSGDENGHSEGSYSVDSNSGDYSSEDLSSEGKPSGENPAGETDSSSDNPSEGESSESDPVKDHDSEGYDPEDHESGDNNPEGDHTEGAEDLGESAYTGATGTGAASSPEESGEGATSYETAPVIEPGTEKTQPQTGKEAEFSEMVRAGKYTVRIRADKGVLPKGTRANVRILTGEESRPYAEKAERMAGEGIAEAVIDIEFHDSMGNEIQPSGMVSVVFENAAEEDADMSVYHAPDSDVSRMEEIRADQEGDDIAIRSSSFSPYVLLAAGSEPDWTKGGKGSWKDVKGELDLRFSDDDKHYYQMEPRGFADGGISATFIVLRDNDKRAGVALCANPGLNPASSGSPDRIYESDCPMLVKALYYGAYGPGSDVIRRVAAKYGFGDDLGAKDLITHFAIAKITDVAGMSKSGDVFRGTSSTLKEIVKAYVREIEDLSVPDYRAYVFSYNDSGRQDFAFGSVLLTEHNGKVQVRKEPDNPDIVRNNDCYSIEKAYYRIYKTRAQAKALSDEGILAKIVTDENGYTETVELKAGTYYLVESKASKGYEISKEVTEFTVTEDKTNVVKVKEVPDFFKADLRIMKKSRDTESAEANSLEGTQFTVKYYDGYYNASTLPEKALRTWVIRVRKSGNSYLTEFSEDSKVSGGEFYKDGSAVVLPLGTITIRETKAAPGYINDGKFGKADMYIGRIRQKSEGTGTELIDISGERKTANTFEVSDTPDSPGIGTKAVNKETGTQLAAAGSDVTISDTVTYRNLVIGKEYVLKGRAVDQKTGKPVTDADGNEVAAEKKFTPSGLSGETSMDFRFRTDSSFSGRRIVFFESVESEGKQVAAHEDREDESQTICFPGIRTKAVNTATNDHIMPAGKETAIRDTVSYESLIPGIEYTVKGVLMVRGSSGAAEGESPDSSAGTQGGEPLQVNGHRVTSEKSFTPEQPDGKVELTFTFDASELAGRDIVAFEVLYEGDTVIAEHKDISDKGQTVHVPDVETDAFDKATGKKNTLADKDRMITDKVTYRNLIPGKTYEITGEVKVKSEDAADFDSAVTVPSTITDARLEAEEGSGHGGSVEYDADKVTFVPEGREGETVSGVILVSFMADVSELAGREIVVGETIRCKDVDLAVHRDLEDTRQSDFIPKGQTMAVDAASGIKNSLAAQNRVFRDTFQYENLLVGETYRITGRVMASGAPDESGAALLEEIPSAMTDENGSPVENGYVEFVPEEMSGTIDLYFSIDATELKNRDVTIFEKVTLEGEPVIIHEAADGTQTVYIPEGGTSAMDSETRDRISMPDTDVTVIDTFEYKNLIPGKEYTAMGRLVRRSDGEEISSTLADAQFRETEEGSSIAVSDNAVTFTPGSKDGALLLTFVFDASELKGQDTVVFERVYYNGSEVIVHENIDDERQTIHLPDGHTTAEDPDTNDRTVKAEGTVIIRDRFHYENLMPGREYAVHGKVMLKPADGKSGTGAREIGAEMVDAQGNKVEEWRFTPSEKSGSEDIYWRIDAEGLAGRSAVVYETMEYINPDTGDRTVVIVHEDINDEEETVHFPDGGTKALDSESQSHKADADDKVTILDEVTYRNLIPGCTYTVTGTLMDKESGKPVTAGGKTVTETREFTAETADGSVIVEFTFDARELAGRSVVAFEKVFSEGKEVFAHEDLQDKDQSIEFPKRKTPPSDKTKTGDENDMSRVIGAAIAIVLSLIGVAVLIRDRIRRSGRSA